MEIDSFYHVVLRAQKSQTKGGLPEFTQVTPKGTSKCLLRKEDRARESVPYRRITKAIQNYDLFLER